MSMQSMQTLLWRCAADSSFLSAVLRAPRETLAADEFSQDEIELLFESPVSSLTDLAYRVEQWRRGEPLASRRESLALAG